MCSRHVSDNFARLRTRHDAETEEKKYVASSKLRGIAMGGC